MGFWSKLKQFFSLEPRAPILDVVVRCNRCREIVHGQIHLYNDLSIRYEGEDKHYFCRKGLMGAGDNRCFQQVVVEYTFDADRNVIDRRVEGGQFVDGEAKR